MTSNPSDLINAKTLARHLGVSESQILKMARRRTIPSYSLGLKCRRFRLAEVEAALTRMKVAEWTDDERRFARRHQG